LDKVKTIIRISTGKNRYFFIITKSRNEEKRRIKTGKKIGRYASEGI
jgi:hypothetical protein